MIAILCPTRGRPEQLWRMIESAIETVTGGNVVILLDFNNDDPALPEYQKHFDQIILDANSPGMMPTTHRWNALAEQAMKNQDIKLFMLGSDDMVFQTSNWDKAIIDHYNALENKIHVYALQDSRDENGIPHVIVTREYIEAIGYFVSPIFLHWNIDVWTVEIAKASGCFTHLKDFTLAHIKPSDEGKPDETHNRIRSWGWRERDAYVAKTCKHFLEVEKERLANFMNTCITGKHENTGNNR